VLSRAELSALKRPLKNGLDLWFSAQYLT
jgi:hypothetical protein